MKRSVAVAVAVVIAVVDAVVVAVVAGAAVVAAVVDVVIAVVGTLVASAGVAVVVVFVVAGPFVAAGTGLYQLEMPATRRRRPASTPETWCHNRVGSDPILLLQTRVRRGAGASGCLRAAPMLRAFQSLGWCLWRWR